MRRSTAALCISAILAASRSVDAQTGTRAANSTLTAVAGVKVGHYTLPERPTGCTVILVEGNAVGGVEQRGAAPATKETDLLRPLNLVDRVNAVALSGGSAFGLDTATGVMRWLEEHDIGFPTSGGKVPIVPAASIFDLLVGGNPRIRPDANCGYRAAEAATAGPVAEGSIGAGAGATVGKLGGTSARPASQAAQLKPTKSGLGTAAIILPSGLAVAALVVVNAVGDIVDPATGRIVAGARRADNTFADARKLIRAGLAVPPRSSENTTIGVVATNARLTKAQTNRIALMADDAYARAISPSHTLGDGDTVFSLATGGWNGEVDLTLVGALAAEVMADAIVRAGTQATAAAGIPAARDLRK
jgi:L-aminopeptidase/D-esterase-like protein